MPLASNLGLSNIQRMFSFSKKLAKSTGIHHWHPNTNSMSINVFMWPQWCYFNGCHIWHQWHEVSFVHFDGFWCASHRCSFDMDNYKLVNGWRFAQMVKTLKSKNVVIHAQLETLFHHWWCPTRTKGIMPKHGKYDYTHD